MQMVRSPGQSVEEEDHGNRLPVLPSVVAKPLGMTMAIWAAAMPEHANSPSRMAVLCMGAPKDGTGPYWGRRTRQAGTISGRRITADRLRARCSASACAGWRAQAAMAADGAAM